MELNNSYNFNNFNNYNNNNFLSSSFMSKSKLNVTNFVPKKVPLNKTNFTKTKMDKSTNIEDYIITTEETLINNRVVTEINEFLKTPPVQQQRQLKFPRR